MNTITEPQSGIRLATRGPLGMLILSRSATLNALTLEMVKVLSAGLRTLESDNHIKLIVICSDDKRAFCAGGDMKQIRRHALDEDYAAIENYFRNEYALDLAVARCRKPYLALIDGIAMGGGLGISVNGRFRVVTEQAVLAMPESRIGFFPDVGASWFLPRLPLRSGYWLGLTATSVKGPEAVVLGLATHYLASDSLDTLLDTLEVTLQNAAAGASDEAAARVEQILATHSASPAAGEAEAYSQVLARRAQWFADDDLDSIRTRLQQDTTAVDDAAQLLSQLDSASPFSLQTTLKLFRQAEGLDLEDCLQLELQTALEACRHPDLAEGVRAVLVDKDRNPQWTASEPTS